MKIHDDLNALHDSLFMDCIVNGVPGGSGAQVYGNFYRSASCDYSLNLKDVWVTENRWNGLTRQYLDAEALESWLDLIEDRMPRATSHGVAFLRTKMVNPRAAGKNKVTRRWGSCMIGFSFRRFPTPTLSMHSRSCFVGYIGRLDLGVAHKLAEAVGERVGLTPSEIGFDWYLEQATLHSLRSFPGWFVQPEAYAMLKDPSVQTPAVLGARQRFSRYVARDKAGELYGDEAYSIQRVMRMKWHQATKPEGYGDRFFGEGKHVTVTKYPRVVDKDLSALQLKAYRQGDTEGMVEWGDDDE